MKEFVWPPVANPARDEMHKALVRAAVKMTDQRYKEEFEKAPDLAQKAARAREYLERDPECAAQSDWYKAATGLFPLVSQANPKEFSNSALVRPPKSPTYRPDRRKKRIAELYRQHPQASQVKICKMIDKLTPSLELLQSWQKEMRGDRTWYGAYMNPELQQRVKTYLSKIRSATL